MNNFNQKAVLNCVSANFGYYPAQIDITTEHFSVSTLPTLIESINAVTNNFGMLKDWIYPGAQEVITLGAGVSKMPYSARVFGMPKTHTLHLYGRLEKKDIEFVVWILSFFLGMRLTTSEAGFLDSTSTKPNKLVDFVLHKSGPQAAIQVALNFIHSNKGDTISLKRIAAIVHALFIAQNPQNLSFERFQYLYMSLDGCFASLWKAGDKRKPTHSMRIKWMCDKFNIPVPPWAGEQSLIASLRNESFHEAIFFGQPLGFSSLLDSPDHPMPQNLTLQMEALICRLLIAILGVKDQAYITSPINSREMHALTIQLT